MKKISLSTIDFSRLKAEEQVAEMVSAFPKSKKMFAAIRQNDEMHALWDAANYMALRKLHYSDHGRIHGFAAARNALVMLKILKDKGVKTDLIVDKRGDWDDVHLVVMVATLFHDIGNAIHRNQHWITGLILLQNPLDEELRKLYDLVKATFLKVYIFDMIFSHEHLIQKTTMEASIVGLGDYTDITKGRAIGVLSSGKYNIHQIATASIDRVVIKPGKKKAIQIKVELNNSSGIFHVQESLLKNLYSGLLKNHVEIITEVAPRSRKTEKKIIDQIDVLEPSRTEYGFQI